MTSPEPQLHELKALEALEAELDPPRARRWLRWLAHEAERALENDPPKGNPDA